ncbi:16S rRNA (guanine(527)-N(7))-methyltransferase RsmG [Roseovarius aestuarii]|nr:16S rRNA (guanine(527)-N(7))-methyltransferase RsmG [Roseovarius aestuarii]
MTDFGLTDVSRETLERLTVFESLVHKWNPVINLVSRKSLAEIRERHIADSVQVFQAGPRVFDHWLDIGSGGGFPGLVIAILAAECAPDARVTLIESDMRKSTFLRTVVREAGLATNILSERIELVEPQDADVLSARALADLNDLLAFSARHLAQDGLAIFPKGATWKQEVTSAKSQWNFSTQTVKSKLDPDAAILCITGVSRV